MKVAFSIYDLTLILLSESCLSHIKFSGDQV